MLIKCLLDEWIQQTFRVSTLKFYNPKSNMLYPEIHLLNLNRNYLTSLKFLFFLSLMEHEVNITTLKWNKADKAFSLMGQGLREGNIADTRKLKIFQNLTKLSVPRFHSEIHN